MSFAAEGSAAELLVTDREGIRTVTLNRPHRKNAMTWAMWQELADVLRDTGRDRSVRTLVLTGAGSAFCSGADISIPDARHPLDKMRIFADLALQLHELPTPTVAKVTGVAVGAGWNLALGCDLVVATPDATFAQIFARRGLSLDLGGSWLLPKLVGLQQAKRLTLLAETVDADRAAALGLVTWVVAADEIDEFTDDLATRLAAGPPVALAQSKALLNDGADTTLREALAGEARAQSVNFATDDAPEAYGAFAAKRTPRFTGTWSLPPAGTDGPATVSGGRTAGPTSAGGAPGQAGAGGGGRSDVGSADIWDVQTGRGRCGM